jgi:phytoene dehydrogenase-like protein
LTLPGFTHDLCAAVLPLAVASPCFRQLPLARHGLEWVEPPLPLAHPFDDGTAALLYRSVAETARGLGEGDGRAYHRLMAPLVADWEAIVAHALGPLVRPPRHPLALLRFGLLALQPAALLAARTFRSEQGRALFAGLAAHAIRPLEQPLTASFGLLLAMAAHAVGWPFPRGGAQQLTDALVADLRAHGGEVVLGSRVGNLGDLPAARPVLFDLTPRQLLEIAGPVFPPRYRRVLSDYRYGPGVFKLDYALDGPIPWQAAACSRAGTVHLGGTLAEIAAAERLVEQGGHPERPFVLLAQPSLFDPSRAPASQHTAWAYCHVPNGSSLDLSDRIEAQIERFAPGFSARVLARRCWGPADLARHNANYVGGDIAGGANDVWQMLARPSLTPAPYRTPARNIFICSSSTPPGGGVHGMSGYNAARAALRDWPA